MPNKKAVSYPIPQICDYCQSPVIYTSNAEIYGREYGNGRCYKCINCDSYVGVHDGTNIPLGRLANKELRDLKKKAHALFDLIWEPDRRYRDLTYGWLAKQMGIPKRECHFGWFGKAQLLRAIDILKKSASGAATPKGGIKNNSFTF